MIDRTQELPIYAIGKPDILTPNTLFLDNQLPVYLLHTGTQEVTRIDFIFDAGLWSEQKALQAALCNAMLQEGSTLYSGAKIAEIFDSCGAYIQCFVDHHSATVSLISLNKHLPDLLPVTEDLIKHAVFSEHELNTLVKRRKQRFFLENEKVKVLCQKKFSEMLFGASHPYSQTVTAADYDLISRDDLYYFYSKRYNSGNCRILVSGKFDDNFPDLLNRHFGGDEWGGEKTELFNYNIQSSIKKEHQVTKKEAVQSAIRIGRLMVQKDHADYLGLQVLVTVLGGYFSSRLMANIREEKGYTYGINSLLIGSQDTGYLLIATETDKSYVKDTIKEVFLELKRLREEAISDDELNRVRQYLLGEFIRDFDGPFAQAQSFRAVADFGLDNRFYEKYYETLNTINTSRLQDLAQQYFVEADFFTVVAGD